MNEQTEIRECIDQRNDALDADIVNGWIIIANSSLIIDLLCEIPREIWKLLRLYPVEIILFAMWFVHSLPRVHRCDSSLSAALSFSFLSPFLSRCMQCALYTMVKLQQRITPWLKISYIVDFIVVTTIINSLIHDQLVSWRDSLRLLAIDWPKAKRKLSVTN